MVMPALALLGRVVDRVEGAELGLALAAARYLVIAAVSVVLPWSTWPIVPTLTCGLVRSNFFLAICVVLLPGFTRSDACAFCDEFRSRHVARDLVVVANSIE